MMDIYNINKKLAQEKLNSDKPIKWIAIYNNGKSDDFGACDLLSFKNEDIDLYPLIDFLCWTLYFDEYVKPFDVDIRFYPYFVKSLPNTDEFNLTNIFRKQYEKYLDV